MFVGFSTAASAMVAEGLRGLFVSVVGFERWRLCGRICCPIEVDRGGVVSCQ